MINNIHAVSNAAASGAVEPVSKAVPLTQAGQTAGVTDSVEISTAARLAAKVAELPDVRTDLVERVKAEIAAGTYDTPERLSVAVDRLLQDILTTL